MSKSKERPAEREGSVNEREYDLEERTARLGEDVIMLARRVKEDAVNASLVGQVVRSATSVGANYADADDTQTKKDFRHKIGLCLREAKETKHWLRMLAKANEDLAPDCRKLWQEAQELTLIFSAIVRKVS